jgi:hypothetical protein
MSDHRAEAVRLLAAYNADEIAVPGLRILDLIARGLAAEQAERAAEARAVEAERVAAARRREHAIAEEVLDRTVGLRPIHMPELDDA